MVKGMKLAPELLLKLLVGMLPVEKHAARKPGQARDEIHTR